jgi:hypothetical protein
VNELYVHRNGVPGHILVELDELLRVEIDRYDERVFGSLRIGPAAASGVAPRRRRRARVVEGGAR